MADKSAVSGKQGVCKRYAGHTEKYAFNAVFIRTRRRHIKQNSFPLFNLREAVRIGTNRFYLSITFIVMFLYEYFNMLSEFVFH